MTPSEILLWSKLKNKQLGVPFCRQKPLLNYIVDFYCHKARLVIECDGGQHYADEHEGRDFNRDQCLSKQGLLVLRFDNTKIINQIDSVMLIKLETLKNRM